MSHGAVAACLPKGARDRVIGDRRVRSQGPKTTSRLPPAPRLASLALAPVLTMTLTISLTISPAISPTLRPAHAEDTATNPYILELLRRTDENRARRREENLQHYYDKNFREYFDYTGRVSPELQAEIDAWKKKKDRLE
jgi:hypothetical protein